MQEHGMKNGNKIFYEKSKVQDEDALTELLENTEACIDEKVSDPDVEEDRVNSFDDDLELYND
jgi:hypothetical protein